MRRLTALALASLALSACKDKTENPPPPPPEVRTAETLPAGSPVPVTSFSQTVADTAGLGVVFPGQANTWVVDRDFSLATGFGQQFASALVLYTGTPTGPLSHANLVADLLANTLDAYPYDQAASEAVFLTPLFDSTDGIVTAASSDGVAMGVPAISGTRSGYLNGTSDSRLSRTLALTVGETYTFTWTHNAVLRAGALVGSAASPYGPLYQVVLRDATTGAALGAPLFSSSDPSVYGTESVTRSGLPAQVVLSFELRSAAEGYAAIDDVTLADGAGAVTLANGDFEAAGLSPWAANAGAESQNVRSGPRSVGAAVTELQVTRTFYAPPSATWGRLVDVFENTGTATVTTQAVYFTILGGATPVAAVRDAGATVVGWDADATARDVGLVFGDGTAFVADGDPFVFVVHDLSVPAGGKVALVHFVVQLGGAAGGATSADVPASTDAECTTIAAGFPSVDAYAIDLEPGVRDVVANFVR